MSASGNKSWPPPASRFEVVTPDRTWILSSGDNLSDAALWVEHLMDCLKGSATQNEDDIDDEEEGDDEYGGRETVGGDYSRETVGGADDGAFDFLEALGDQAAEDEDDDADEGALPTSDKVLLIT